MMTRQENSSVIQKKARHAREDFDARAMSPAKALRLSLEKCSDRLFDLAVTVGTVEQRRLPHAALKQEAGSDSLILLLDGPEGERGAALIDRQFVQALLEVQTMGAVRPGTAAERPFTGTDAAIAAPLADALLEEFDTRMADADARQAPGRFRFGDRVADARALTLALEAPEFELFRFTLDIASGAKTGVMGLVLPQAAIHRAEPASAAGGRQRAAFEIRDMAMSAPVTLDAVLDRVELPLARVCALEPGMTLPIGAAAIGQTELVASRGHVAAVVQLGQMNGFRAVRLSGGGQGEARRSDAAAQDGSARREEKPQQAAQARPARPGEGAGAADRPDRPGLPDMAADQPAGLAGPEAEAEGLPPARPAGGAGAGAPDPLADLANLPALTGQS